VLLVVPFTVPTAAAQVPALPPELPIVFDSWEVLPETVAVQTPIDQAPAPGGGLYVADMYTGHIVRLAADGSRVWRIGGKGDGPGEFNMLYRLGSRPDGTLLAYDLAGNAISSFSDEGEFVERRVLELHLRAIDDVVSPDSSMVLISGVPFRRLHPEVEAGIHRFDGELRYQGSFGPLPPAVDREKLEFWGAGRLRVTRDGLVLYAVKQPYELYWYALDGTERRHLTIDLPIRGTVDEVFEITRGGGRWKIETGDRNVTRPGMPLRIAPDRLLDIRIEGDTRHWDVLTDDGEVVATAELPRSYGSPTVVDPERGVMWLLARVAMEPRIVRATYRLRGD
jgi:hypothetical protein